jgi:hypothetical protein
MVTRTSGSPNIVAASKIELANRIKAKLAEFNRTAVSDTDFRVKVMEYFKPEKSF